MSRVLIAGVGHSHLSDLSVGPIVAEQLRAEPWPPHIGVEDWSYGPISVTHRLHDDQDAVERVVIVGAVDRERPPGTVRIYRWDGVLPPAEMVQARVAEAITGVVSLDILVVVTAQFGALPAEVFIVEIQPLVQEFGLTFSAPVGAALEYVKRTARAIAEGTAENGSIPTMPLGGMIQHAP